MRESIRSLVIVGSASLLGACGSGGAAGGAGRPTGTVCEGAAAFCLSSCNVGCVGDGCQLRQIARNHQLRFQFTQPVDPNSVDFTTISLRTPTGAEPTGEFVVEGETITFVPSVQRVGAATFFGFAPDEEYLLTLPGGPDAPLALRSRGGDPLERNFTCSLTVTQGVVDFDGEPPFAEVVAPSVQLEVARDSRFVFRFSELIDHAPFVLEPNGPDAPMTFRLLARSVDGSCREIADDRDAPLLFGSFRLDDDTVAGHTTLTFTPAQDLPGNRCVEATVTSLVRDLAGTAAQPLRFRFRVDRSNPIQDSIRETFDDSTNLDVLASAGEWVGGVGEFFEVGGDGRHGEFDHRSGERIDGEWVFRTDGVFNAGPSARLRGDLPNGEFHFTRFVIPASETVRFVGANPARIRVQGECEIRGRLICSGADVAQFADPDDPDTMQRAGQFGSVGGPGGARGGQGGRQCDGQGPAPDFANDGTAGGDVRVSGGHAYALAVGGTGGTGSKMFPSHGLASQLGTAVFGSDGACANGGGGGGYSTAGGVGHVVVPGHIVLQTPGPSPVQDAAGGSEFSPLPIVGSSWEHLAIGGSGGGGGGSHPFLFNQRRFMAGAGGGGGGGALALRVGRTLRIAASGAIHSRGGAGFGREYASIIERLPAPGGGGAGGTILIQLADARGLTLLGELDVRGGAGGFLVSDNPSVVGETRAGSGADGLYRFESPEPIDTQAWSLDARPAPGPDQAGVLMERDVRVGMVSKIFDTGLAVAPIYTHYVVEAIVDGQPVTFSDDDSIGSPAIAGAAVEFYVQGVAIDPATGEPMPLDTDWTSFVGEREAAPSLARFSRSGFRWALVADRSVAEEVSIDAVEVFFTH